MWYKINITGFTSLVSRHFDLLSDKLQEFIFYHLKDCDDCGYCTQTNKKERKPLFVKIEHNGKILNKCPLYPWLAWEKLNEEAVLIIKEFIELSEKIYMPTTF